MAKRVGYRAAALLLAERDPVLARLVAAAGPPTIPVPRETHFATLVRSITYQQLATSAARAIHGRLVAVLDGDVTAERVLATPVDTLRAAGDRQVVGGHLPDVPAAPDGRLADRRPRRPQGVRAGVAGPGADREAARPAR
jgi:hypothetical protein